MKFAYLSHERRHVIRMPLSRWTGRSGDDADCVLDALRRAERGAGALLPFESANHPMQFGTVGPASAAERQLVLRLDAFGAVVTHVGESLAPEHICKYLRSLAKDFSICVRSGFASGSDSAYAAALCLLTARTLRTGLDLIGV
ncbi:DALR anticodon-binding domain-containing protein [Nocardia vinacea]|uniref:DALR anticodon-binding domain-containing protein n=1 Tax=Nocardia vinacea TaxID=96468 RepID=UPI0033CB0B1F